MRDPTRGGLSSSLNELADGSGVGVKLDETATIESIEQDFEDRFQVAVTLDDDPGKDLGQARQSGHRFFLKPDEIVPLDDSGARP